MEHFARHMVFVLEVFVRISALKAWDNHAFGAFFICRKSGWDLQIW